MGQQPMPMAKGLEERRENWRKMEEMGKVFVYRQLLFLLLPPH
jgi:hypothetical protein